MQYQKKMLHCFVFLTQTDRTFSSTILFYYCNSPEAVHGYVNSCVLHLYKHYTTDECLHSSFVVFYFVFVLRLLPDVNHGATDFLLLAKTTK